MEPVNNSGLPQSWIQQLDLTGDSKVNKDDYNNANELQKRLLEAFGINGDSEDVSLERLEQIYQQNRETIDSRLADIKRANAQHSTGDFGLNGDSAPDKRAQAVERLLSQGYIDNGDGTFTAEAGSYSAYMKVSVDENGVVHLIDRIDRPDLCDGLTAKNPPPTEPALPDLDSDFSTIDRNQKYRYTDSKGGVGTAEVTLCLAWNNDISMRRITYKYTDSDGTVSYRTVSKQIVDDDKTFYGAHPGDVLYNVSCYPELGEYNEFGYKTDSYDIMKHSYHHMYIEQND